MFRFFIVWTIYYYTSDMIPVGLWQFWYWYVSVAIAAPTVLFGWAYATTVDDEDRWEKFGWWLGWYAMFGFMMIRYLDGFFPSQFLAPPTDFGVIFGFMGLFGVLAGLLINFIGWVRYTLSYDNAWH